MGGNAEMAKLESRKGLLTTAAALGGDFQSRIAFVDGAEGLPSPLIPLPSDGRG